MSMTSSFTSWSLMELNRVWGTTEEQDENAGGENALRFCFLVLGGPADHAPGCLADRMWWGAALSNSSGKPRRFHDGQVNTDGDYREVQPRPREPAGLYRCGLEATGSYHPGSKDQPPPRSQQVYRPLTTDTTERENKVLPPSSWHTTLELPRKKREKKLHQLNSYS